MTVFTQTAKSTFVNMDYVILINVINGHYIQITLISKLQINNLSATDQFKNASNQSVFSFHSAVLKIYLSLQCWF